MIYKDKVGFVGLGNMGHPMAKNLEAAGIELFVFNRTPEKTEDFQEKSTICHSLGDLIQQVDIIFTMLSNDDAVYAVYENLLQHDINGKLFVDMSTVSKETSISIAASLAAKSASFIDAPVAGSTNPAKQGTLLFMTGCNDLLFERIKPYLEIMGKAIKHLGDNGMGVSAKLCINYYLSILFQGMAETVLFAEKLGISRSAMMEIINESASGSGASKVKTNSIVDNKFPAAFSLDLMLKDIKLAIDAGAQLPFSNTLLETYQGAHNAGHGAEDVMAIIQYLKETQRN
ncbi:NAD(P)-dependent oxidoreductase [Sphingobacterium sp. HJSM2_6]|uniref:NAD(P)-dependent oxidoreductase n=1 Tax=Sphingobacterium sp. HJSM2_6 TaxID=3366264 RepID=UPI003BE8A6AA